jgi:dihydroorotate dehydrogenase (NAD+) catalytic subunit
MMLDNPIIPASGTFGFGYEFKDFYDINILGSMVLKSITKSARFGNDTPRIAECKSGMLNAIGLQNPGIEAFLEDEVLKINKIFKKKIIASVAGFSEEEYVYVAKKFNDIEIVGMLEINISCPNIKKEEGKFFSSEKNIYSLCREIRKVVKKPFFIKLSPNTENVISVAKAAEDAGANGITACNTYFGMAIDPRNGKVVVSTKKAGFSGPAIKPLTVRLVYEIFENVKVPIMGSGGISNSDDVIEFMYAGATATQIGSQNLINPTVCKEIISDLPKKIKKYNIKSLKDIIGKSHY